MSMYDTGKNRAQKGSNRKILTTGKVWQYRQDAHEWMARERLVWDTARRFLDGLQYGRRYEQGRSSGVTWTTEPSKPGVSRVTVNLLLPIFNRLQAMLSVVTPYIGVRPASMTTSDMIRAKTDAAMVQYLWEASKVAEAYQDANRWLIGCGNSFMHPYYCMERERIVIDVVPPYDILCQHTVDNLQDSEWLIKRTYLHSSVIKRAYPKIDLEAVTPVNYELGQDRSNFTYANTTTETEDQYEVLEYWSKADSKHCIIIGEQVAWEAKKWDAKQSYPIIHMKFHNLPGRLHGKGAIDPLVQIQKEYNAQRSAIITNIRRMGNLQWLVASNSGVDAITNEPGAIIRYNPASIAPKQVPLNPLPGYVLDNVNRSHSEMMDLAGIHGTSLGKRVSGVESGKAIQQLVAQDTSQLQGVLDSIEKGARELSSHMLRLAKEHYSKARMVRVFRYDGGMFFKMVKGTDLSDDPDVFFEASSLFKDHLKEREQRAVQMFQLGLLTPEEARKAISFFGQDAMIHQSVRNYNYALDLLEDALSGDQIMVLPTDPQKEIIEVFQEYTTSEEFRELPTDIQDNVSGVLIAVIAQGNPQVAANLEQPVYPMQQQQQQPGPMGPMGMAAPTAQANASGGGTAEGAAQRTENQQMAQAYEGFNPRSGGGM
tara:strand:+ start:1914 stop:3875 length:1962 start_codon:yes stop_codon:yes gene_type:complete